MKNILFKSLATGFLFSVIVQQALADEARDEFNFLDRNNNGVISYDEFFVAFVHDGSDASQELQEMFTNADSNNDKFLTFTEAKKLDATPEDFQQADKNQDKKVNFDEFLDAAVSTLFKEADLDNNNTVDLAEFIQARNNDS